MKNLILTLSLLAVSATAQARDLHNFHALGFSSDGKYYAFAESVIQDGSGFADARVSVIDVAANNMVASKRVILEREDAKEEQALARAIKEVNLGKFGIRAKANTGKDLLVREITDRSTYTDTVFTTYYYRMYQLIVEATALPEDESCFTTQGELLKLTIKGTGDEENRLMNVLQNDKALPESRKCAASYSVARVTRFGDSLVVMMTYHTNGFEGSDVHFMAVTAKIELQ